MTQPDLTQQITDNAAAPASASNASESMRQQPLQDVIAADRYLKANAAVKKGLGIRHVKLIPPSAADVDFKDNHRGC